MLSKMFLLKSIFVIFLSLFISCAGSDPQKTESKQGGPTPRTSKSEKPHTKIPKPLNMIRQSRKILRPRSTTQCWIR